MFIVKFKINTYNNKNNDRKMLVLLTESPVSGAGFFPQKTPVFLNTFILRKPTELHIRNIPREKQRKQLQIIGCMCSRENWIVVNEGGLYGAKWCDYHQVARWCKNTMSILNSLAIQLASDCSAAFPLTPSLKQCREKQRTQHEQQYNSGPHFQKEAKL